jgi:hypothetical protein
MEDHEVCASSCSEIVRVTLRGTAGRKQWGEEICQGLPTYVLFHGAMSEVQCAAAVLGHDVAIPKQFVFVGREAIEPHRASCMKFACADTQFGPKPITETVCEAR